MHGIACISGTRIPVSVVLDNLAVRVSEERLLREYPSLTPAAVAAALAYAAELAQFIATHNRRDFVGADPEIQEEWKWEKPKSPGTPVWSQDDVVCTGESYKQVVKLTFARGASITDP